MRPFDTRFYHEDYALWLELLRDGCRAVGTAEVLADYRILPGSRSNNKWKSARHRWEIYRDLLGLSPVKRSALMLRYTLSGLRKYANTSYSVWIQEQRNSGAGISWCCWKC